MTTISGLRARVPLLQKLYIKHTVSAGLAIVSPNINTVFGLNAMPFSSSSIACQEMQILAVIPVFAMAFRDRLKVTSIEWMMPQYELYTHACVEHGIEIGLSDDAGMAAVYTSCDFCHRVTEFGFTQSAMK